MADWTGKRNGPDYTVDIPRKLSIADLAQANSRVPSRGPVDSADPGVGGDPVAEAKAFLAPYERQDRAAQNAELARKNVMAPEYTHSSLRRLTSALDAMGSGVSTASLPGYLLGPEVGGPMSVIGGALKVPEYMRRRIAPDVNAGEQEAGIMEGAGLGTDIALGGLLGRGKAAASEVSNGAADLRKTFGVHQASEQPYRMYGSVQPEVPGVRPAADWLDRTIGSGRGTGLTQETLDRGAKAGLPTTENAWKSLGDLNRRPEGYTNSSESVKDFIEGGKPRLVDIQRPDPTFTFEGSGPQLADLPTSSIDSPGWNTISGGPAAPVAPFPTAALPKGGSTKGRAEIIKARDSMWDRSNFRPKGK